MLVLVTLLGSPSIIYDTAYPEGAELLKVYCAYERPSWVPWGIFGDSSPYLVGIITYNGLTGIFAVKTVVVDRSWTHCVFP